jgi:Domain of unknown function (DUF4347)
MSELRHPLTAGTDADARTREACTAHKDVDESCPSDKKHGRAPNRSREQLSPKRFTQTLPQANEIKHLGFPQVELGDPCHEDVDESVQRILGATASVDTTKWFADVVADFNAVKDEAKTATTKNLQIPSRNADGSFSMTNPQNSDEQVTIWLDRTIRVENAKTGSGYVEVDGAGGSLAEHRWGKQSGENYDLRSWADGTTYQRFQDGSGVIYQPGATERNWGTQFKQHNEHWRPSQGPSLNSHGDRNTAWKDSMILSEQFSTGIGTLRAPNGNEYTWGPQSADIHATLAHDDTTASDNLQSAAASHRALIGESNPTAAISRTDSPPSITQDSGHDKTTIVIPGLGKRGSNVLQRVAVDILAESGKAKEYFGLVNSIDGPNSPKEIVDDLLEQSRKDGKQLGDVVIGCHGAPNGIVMMGNHNLYSVDEPDFREQFARLKGHFAPGSKITFLSCELASGSLAANALHRLADATGVSVRAYKWTQNALAESVMGRGIGPSENALPSY